MYHSSTNLTASRHILLWVARGAAIFMFGVFCLFAVGEGLARQPLSVQVTFAGLGLIFAGYALGWRHPLPGGGLALLGVIGINAVEFVVNGKMAGSAFLLFGVPGLLYLNAWYWCRPRAASA